MTSTDSQVNQPGGGAAFDDQRAGELRTKVVGEFLRRARKIERRLSIWLVVLLAFACVYTRNFFDATHTQGQILWATLFLVMIESTILIKLWYWVVSTRLGTQRELRLLRFDLAAGSQSPRGLEELAQVESPFRPPGLPRWERAVWTAAIIVLGVAVGLGGDLRMLKLFGPRPPVFQLSTRLAADGSGQMATTWTYQNREKLMLTEVPLYNGGAIEHTQCIPSDQSSYKDASGRTLAVRREPAGQNHRDVIQLIDPVPFTRAAELHWSADAQASRDGDAWVYELGPGNPERVTIELPAGAELVSVEPAEDSRELKDGRLSLRFVNRDDKLTTYRVKYGLPSAATQ